MSYLCFCYKGIKPTSIKIGRIQNANFFIGEFIFLISLRFFIGDIEHIRYFFVTLTRFVSDDRASRFVTILIKTH